MEIRIGTVTHYFNRISVAVLKLSGELRVGDKVLFLGRTTDFTQAVTSMEIEHHKIATAGSGMEVAVKVADTVHCGDEVYKIVESEQVGA
jgi:hypothetical protein